jgi:large subunit ribosomal protein L29
MKTADLRKMSETEIEKMLEETRKELMLLRFQAVSGQLTDTSKLTKTKREVARIATILREKQMDVKEEGKHE